MKFNPEATELFSTDGTTFEYNHERAEYISEQIHEQYQQQLSKLGNKYKAKKAKGKDPMKLALNILALHNEWNVADSDDTLYLVFNDDDRCFTDVTTENEYYANPLEE